MAGPLDHQSPVGHNSQQQRRHQPYQTVRVPSATKATVKDGKAYGESSSGLGDEIGVERCVGILPFVPTYLLAPSLLRPHLSRERGRERLDKREVAGEGEGGVGRVRGLRGVERRLFGGADPQERGDKPSLTRHQRYQRTKQEAAQHHSNGMKRRET